MTRGFLVAAPKSGSGKTTVTLGLMRAFTRRGLAVSGIKNGPDYIDSAFHAAATGRDCLNLDSWAMNPALVDALAREGAAGADLLIGEGSMGLFDGVAAPAGRTGATSDLASRLGLPVMLVLDIGGQSQTAAAIVKGCDCLDPKVRVAGVVLNKVASERHRRLAAEAIEAAGYRVLGALPREASLALPERHLGLVQAGETAGLEGRLDALADFVLAHVDLDAVWGIGAPFVPRGGTYDEPLKPPGRRIAVASDAAFTFLYPHLAQGWRRAGSELVFFSPLADEPPPDTCDMCWLPGGYPELHAGRLAAAQTFQSGLRRFAGTRPVHGECGGYMVLGQSIIDAEGGTHEMAGLLNGSTSFAKRKMTLGYRDVTLAADCCLGLEGLALRGHEFHYATTIPPDAPDPPLVIARDAHGGPGLPAGGRRGRVTGSFFHLIASV